MTLFWKTPVKAEFEFQGISYRKVDARHAVDEHGITRRFKDSESVKVLKPGKQVSMKVNDNGGSNHKVRTPNCVVGLHGKLQVRKANTGVSGKS